MSNQLKIDFENLAIEDGDTLYDMEYLAKLNKIYERLCTAEYVFDNWDEVTSMEQAYCVADFIREKMDDVCTCESEMLTFWAEEALEYADACLDEPHED